MLFNLLFFSPLFLEGKRKAEKNNQSRGEKSCLSDPSKYFVDVRVNISENAKKVVNGVVNIFFTLGATLLSGDVIKKVVNGIVNIFFTLGATLLSGDVIKKVVNGIVNMDAYRSNKTAIIANWTRYVTK